MLIDIFRHGIAEDAAPGGSDAERRLTEEGIRKLRQVLERARVAKVSPSLIVTSPYVRAVQTAELAAEILKYKQKIVRTEALSPDSSPQQVWEEIRSRRDEEEILLAGHEPLLGQAAAFLLGTPALNLDMKKGAIVRIYMENFGPSPRGVLQWMLTPKLAADEK